LGIIRTSSEVEELASKVQDSGGVYFVPAFAGLGAPHWNQDARGTLVGMTRGSTSAHIARAALDSIAYQTLEVLEAMEIDSKIHIRELRVDGGATANNLLMQFQSDIIGAKVIRPKITETTALGAAYLAGLAVGFWKSADELENQWQMEQVFKPSMTKSETEPLIKEWHRAVAATKYWANNL